MVKTFFVGHAPMRCAINAVEEHVEYLRHRGYNSRARNACAPVVIDRVEPQEPDVDKWGRDTARGSFGIIIVTRLIILCTLYCYRLVLLLVSRRLWISVGTLTDSLAVSKRRSVSLDGFEMRYIYTLDARHIRWWLV